MQPNLSKSRSQPTRQLTPHFFLQEPSILHKMLKHRDSFGCP